MNVTFLLVALKGRSLMKKYFSVILVLMLVFTVFGCGKNEITDEESIKSTITKFYQSWEDEDIVALSSCIDSEFTDEFFSKSEYVEEFNQLFSEFDLSYKDLKFADIFIVGDLATADITITLTRKTLNSETTDTTNAKFYMIKRGVEWLLRCVIQYY